MQESKILESVYSFPHHNFTLSSVPLTPLKLDYQMEHIFKLKLPM